MVDNSHICHEDVTFNFKVTTRGELYEKIERELGDMDVDDLDEWSFTLRWERLYNDPDGYWRVVCNGVRRRLPST